MFYAYYGLIFEQSINSNTNWALHVIPCIIHTTKTTIMMGQQIQLAMQMILNQIDKE